MPQANFHAPIIWIFTEGEEIESRLPFKIFSTLKGQIMKIKSIFKKDFNSVVWLFEQNLGAVKQNDYFPFPHKNASAKARDADFRHPCKTFWGGFHLYLFPFTFQTSKFKNQFTISSKYFDIACYLKQETYSGPIFFEVQQNDIWTDNIQSFEMPLYIVQQHWELELFTESQLGEVQMMKPSQFWNYAEILLN